MKIDFASSLTRFLALTAGLAFAAGMPRVTRNEGTGDGVLQGLGHQLGDPPPIHPDAFAENFQQPDTNTNTDIETETASAATPMALRKASVTASTKAPTGGPAYLIRHPDQLFRQYMGMCMGEVLDPDDPHAGPLREDFHKRVTTAFSRRIDEHTGLRPDAGQLADFAAKLDHVMRYARILVKSAQQLKQDRPEWSSFILLAQTEMRLSELRELVDGAPPIAEYGAIAAQLTGLTARLADKAYRAKVYRRYLDVCIDPDVNPHRHAAYFSQVMRSYETEVDKTTGKTHSNGEIASLRRNLVLLHSFCHDLKESTTLLGNEVAPPPQPGMARRVDAARAILRAGILAKLDSDTPADEFQRGIDTLRQSLGLSAYAGPASSPQGAGDTDD
ncbi:hypothetical protein GT347_13085 [Xylophilus rhododendri]|uniref:Uncharacterized protein n=1 Tax=Xylophilus rhododendri TaxID=2697032 RepID=A0A857J4F2_9BURK|nr:hypothetical protein [Xylophilus rhododendri]QHI98840.1 hypothetical protein GT347_13085 [Xylophilus rhododendri]